MGIIFVNTFSREMYNYPACLIIECAVIGQSLKGLTSLINGRVSNYGRMAAGALSISPLKLESACFAG